MVRDKNKTWTEEHDRQLLEMRAAGRSSVSIGNALKRSVKAVNGRLSMLRARARKNHTWYVTTEIPWKGTTGRGRRSRTTVTFDTEMKAKDFARENFDAGLVVTAGTIIPHSPRRAMASGSIPSWLEEGREQDNGVPHSGSKP